MSCESAWAVCLQAYQGSDLLGALVLAQWVSKATANCVSAPCASLKSQANGFAYSITNNLDSAGNTPTYTYINMVRPFKLLTNLICLKGRSYRHFVQQFLDCHQKFRRFVGHGHELELLIQYL